MTLTDGSRQRPKWKRMSSPTAIDDEARPLTGGGRVAKLMTNLLSPGVIIVVVVAVQAVHSATTVWQAWISGVIGVVTGSAIPIAYIVRGVRRGRLTDLHVGVRDQRRLPLAVALVSGTFGTVLLGLTGGRDMMVSGVAGMASLVVAIAITAGLRWKVSIHAIVAAGAAALLTITFGPWLALTWPVAVVIGWSRVRLGDHTVAQVAVGSVIGAVVTSTVYALVR
jgi:membrane-associated phospholipid phosphatase